MTNRGVWTTIAGDGTGKRNTRRARGQDGPAAADDPAQARRHRAGPVSRPARAGLWRAAGGATHCASGLDGRRRGRHRPEPRRPRLPLARRLARRRLVHPLRPPGGTLPGGQLLQRLSAVGPGRRRRPRRRGGPGRIARRGRGHGARRPADRAVGAVRHGPGGAAVPAGWLPAAPGLDYRRDLRRWSAGRPGPDRGAAAASRRRSPTGEAADGRRRLPRPPGGDHPPLRLARRGRRPAGLAGV